MTLSIIICTYRRREPLVQLLMCLADQLQPPDEVLVVDGSGEDAGLAAHVESLSLGRLPVRYLVTRKGLTHQRNRGLCAANGQLVAFLDDDVVVPPEFSGIVRDVFQQDDAQRVGGLCGYDTVAYPQRISLRWKLRRLLGVVPTLQPGSVDRLGRSVPLSFSEPFAGLRSVGWLPGFCMIYQRHAIEGLSFDETLPTYAGEDRDFSLRVGDSWRLVMSGDLRLEHRQSHDNRPDDNRRVYETAFGIGRTFAKRMTSIRDRLVVVRYLLSEVLIECLSFCCHPSWTTLRSPGARLKGLWDGLSSLPDERSPARALEGSARWN